MVHLVSLLPSIILLGANAVAVRDGAEVTKQQRLDKFAQIFEQVQQNMHIPGMSIVLITPKSSGSVASNDLPYDVFFKSYGVRNASSKEPIDENTIHIIGSTTKLFTAHVVAMLEEQGLVDWNTPVKNYADVSFSNPEAQAKANFIDLLSHSTGVGDAVDLYPKKGDPLNLIKESESLPPIGEFRNSYHYSNDMFSLAGSIASNVLNVTSNDPFEGWRRIVQEKIFGQLGMESATVDFESYMNTPFPADTPHSWQLSNTGKDKYRVFARNVNEFFYHTISPAGVIALNIKDYSKWLMYLLDVAQNGKSSMANIVSKKNHDLIFAPHNDFLTDADPDGGSYGLGVGIREYKGHKVAFHNGAVLGQTTQMCVFLDAGYAFASFSNSEYTHDGLAACEDIFDQFILNQDLAEAGTKTLAAMNLMVSTLNDGVEDNIRLIQQHSLTPILPPSQPKRSYVGTFRHSEFNHTLYTTTLVSETPFRLKLLPTDSYETCNSVLLCETVQHWTGDQFVMLNGDLAVPSH